MDRVRIVCPGERIIETGLRIADGAIAALGETARQDGDRVVEGRSRLLTPGLIDLHVHGLGHNSFDSGPEALRAAAGAFARFGTTTVLPTVVPMQAQQQRDARHVRTALDALAALAGALDRVQGVNMPGLHLEGPFLALPGAGGACIAGDLGLLDDLLSAGRNRVCAMSLSPDVPGILPIIERLRDGGVIPFVTHTRATRREAQAAIAAGARHATHFYDVFPLPDETDPGVRPVGAVEAYLADPAATVDFIADGCHVDPLAIQLAVRLKGCAGVAVISDANVGAGLPPGEYPTPWGYPVRVHPDHGARNADPDHPKYGGLSGSALTLDRAMRNVLRWLDEPPWEIWSMGTSSPARIAGLRGKGTMAVGSDADLVLWNEDLTPATTWVGGVCVWDASGDMASHGLENDHKP